MQNPVDPNSVMMDTSGLRSIMTARKTPDGEIETGCQHSTEIECTKAHDAADGAASAAGTQKQEVDQ